MAFWTIDLTTEDGARGAAQNGGLACLIAALLGVLGLIAFAAMEFAGVPFAVLAWMLAEIAIFAVAAFRLRVGKGLIWGSVSAALLVLEIVGKLYVMVQTRQVGSLLSLAGLVADAMLLIVLINGLRGAWALRYGKLGSGDAAEIFS